MWICLNNAFLSVVEADDPNFLMIRARDKQHLVDVFPEERIITTPMNDYRYRVIVPRTEFAEHMAQMVLDVDYKNFKNSVKNKKLHDMYLKFWDLCYEFQNGRRWWLDYREHGNKKHHRRNKRRAG